MNPLAGFVDDYAQAREAFRAAAAGAGLDVHAYAHPLLGPSGETLAVDVALDGPPGAAALLMVSSGCHGVEGHAGTGAQVALLHDTALRRAAAEGGVALLHVHALNPWGYAWCRRVTQENVDLNRNVVDFDAPLPRNTAYDELAPHLVPPTWPPTEEHERALQAYAMRHGLRALQAAISGGQHHHPEGLFYGGVNPTWSHRTWRALLRDHARRCRHLGWIDVHTGLGAPGGAERILAGPADAALRRRAAHWWGPDVTVTDDGTSSSAVVEGALWRAIAQECPQAEYTGIVIEFGTVPLPTVLQALRADQWLENHPEFDTTPLRATIKRGLRDAFYVDTDDWKRGVVAGTREAAAQAIRALSAP